MTNIFQKDHFIIGYEANDMVYLSNGKDILSDNLKRFGYCSNQKIDKQNNLLDRYYTIRVELFAPLRKGLWCSPDITLVSSRPLLESEVLHFYLFCKKMGGKKITISHVRSVCAFLRNPDHRLILANYIVKDNGSVYSVYFNKQYDEAL